MADVAVKDDAVVWLSKDSAVDTPTGTSVAAGNVAVLTPVTASGSGGSAVAGKPFKARYMLVRLTAAAAASVTPKAGVTGQTPANLAALGDGDAISLGAGDDKVVQLELSRYLQADGTVRLAVATSAVVVSVVNLSKGA